MHLSRSEVKLKPKYLQYNFDAIGTKWFIEIYDTVSESQQITLEALIIDRIETFDTNYSRFREDSLVTKMSRKSGKYILPSDAKPLLDFYHGLYRITDGLVTPLIGQLISDAGYDANYSFKAKELGKPPTWEDAFSYNKESITINQPSLLDFGAAGKGYLIDIIGELLAKQGIARFCIDAGGDILYRNKQESLKIGLEHPDDFSLAIGVAEINNGALCGSAGNRRNWGKYHHIMNPSSLESTTNIKAVWVTAESTMLADGLTTALFFTSAKKLKQQFSFEYAIVYSDGSLEKSAEFPATFFN